MPLRDQANDVGRIIREGLLHPVFQPILDFRAHAYLGFEALIRGPASSPLHLPEQLFAAARSAGLASALEHACREASLRAFDHLGLPGRLFLNVTPDCLLDDRLMNGETCRLLNELGIADDRMKYHFVRAMQDLAEICNASIVAEGIERCEDFAFVRDLGIACGQGYFVARPATSPDRHLSPTVVQALARKQLALSPAGARMATAIDLLRPLPPAPLEASNESVMARFEADTELDVLPVVRGDLPVGLINRHTLFERFARPFHRELYGRASCAQFMDHAPLVVDQQATAQQLATMLALAPKHHLFDGFIITGEGKYLGVGNSHDVMAMITEMQISAARYANPLTQLPGNVPINEHIDRMLAASKDFVVAYLDVDAFKPYNDTYGYRRGDDVIQILGRMICQTVNQDIDFVGHIGGDDFFVVFQSTDWEARCWEIVNRFGEAMSRIGGANCHGHGGYMAENRKGELVSQAWPTLSVGAVRVNPGDCDSHREVAAAVSVAKKEAKKAGRSLPGKLPGGCVFVERRRSGQVEDARLAGSRLKPCSDAAARQRKEECPPIPSSPKVGAEIPPGGTTRESTRTRIV
ncbi:GGDEF domain-containing protein [Accumulibacter sp.]|uniref:GGDEF domain-containing protein n=1 Tax=Accumulibacter sp. TaxID=2053492 RepID=UPI00257FA528|nr:GGDEF domain-containing protein [Accumulibacter sp.]